MRWLRHLERLFRTGALTVWVQSAGLALLAAWLIWMVFCS